MEEQKDRVIRIIQIIFGATCCSIAYKFFLSPAGLYNGGFTGIAQIIRNLLQDNLGIHFRSDPTGILVWCLNVPLMILGYRELGKMFMARTIAVITLQSFLMTVLKSPETQLISDHALNCVFGGALNGFGIGVLLRNGASTGGTDIVGLLGVKRKPDMSVGTLAMTINACIFTYAAVTRTFEVAAYSAVYAFMSSVVIDRTHYQTMKVAVFVVSKVPILSNEISVEMHRGVTTWNAVGGHSRKPFQVHMIVMNRYELVKFRQVIHAVDKHAFIWTMKADQVMGNFKQHLGV
ncbi:MAG: YitT family protein [Lachnospiraceae bacterium]|nr:YitT family protein [Lachnospiraceae bacterium]